MRPIHRATVAVAGVVFFFSGCGTQQPVSNDTAAKTQKQTLVEAGKLRSELDGRVEVLARQLRDEQGKMLAEAEKRIRAANAQQFVRAEGKAIGAEVRANAAEAELARAQESFEAVRAKLAETGVPKVRAAVEQPKPAGEQGDAGGPNPARKKPTPATARLIQSVKKLGGPSELDVEGTITKIDLSGTKINDATITRIKAIASLTSLDLEGTSISNLGILRLIGLENLAELRLAGTSVTEAGTDKLAKANPRLQIIWKPSQRLQAKIIEIAKSLGGEVTTERTASGEDEITSISFWDAKDQNAVTDEFLFLIRHLTSLRSLSLHSDRITDVGIGYLRLLTNMEVARLDKVPITDIGLQCLSGWTKLRRLNLYGTRVTDACLADLRSMKQLDDLYLSVTQVTGRGFKDVPLLALTTIAISDQVTDDGLLAMAGLPSLGTVNVIAKPSRIQLSLNAIRAFKAKRPNARIRSWDGSIYWEHDGNSWIPAKR